jgi:plasmid replication initiation protein
MSNERKKAVARFENRFFELDITNLNAKETDLLMAIISQLREEKTQTVKIPFSILRDLVDYRNCSEEEFSLLMARMREKLRLLELREDPVFGDWYPLFEKTRADREGKYLLFQLNTISIAIFMNLTRNFTQVPLESYVKIRGKYAKRICLYLLKFSGSGYWSISIENFRRVIGVPTAYTAKKINQKILEPAINELSELFEDLEVSCTYGGQRNRTVIGYEFRYRKHASERKAG